MILMLSGTSDGRQIGDILATEGHQLIMTAVSDYGGDRLPNHENIQTRIGHLNKEAMIELIKEKHVKLLLDATHPYAVEASVNAIEAANISGIPYLRYERPDMESHVEDDIIYLPSYEAAALWLKDHAGKVFLTIGSRRLKPFAETVELDRLIARVLPTTEVIQLCDDLGLKPNQIIAMQGPFSETLNTAMFETHQPKYLVTKASSKIGGFEEKVVAASKAGMTTLVIERPQIDYPNCFSDIMEAVGTISHLLR